MAEKKALLCDVCEDRVAKTKCNVCNVDLCNTCAKRISVFDLNPVRAISLSLCRKCLMKLTDLIGDEKFHDEIIKNVSKIIQSSNILNELEE